MNPFRYEFGYAWPYAYGHLIPIAIGAIALILAFRFKRTWLKAIAALVMTWGIAGLLILHFAIRINLPMQLPTAKFLEGREGRVLDVGAGSGRASLMVLLARPRTNVVALDIFSNNYGIETNTPERLFANASIAGVRERLEATSADMREMPFEDASFDAVVSTYAIDHMRRSESIRALHEVHRVLRPGGDFLLAVMRTDAYVHTAFPVLASHGVFGPDGAEQGWREMLEQAGFEIIESGPAPATVYVLARKAFNAPMKEADSG